ncbi:ketopantoate reductase family protein [Rummeliibacillus stabekisii]|uniref:ketopantoate reductase family protein n=1 Tax=Rummeliibacillus stabekisii TaxID=241244 RepID=UPI00371844EB
MDFVIVGGGAIGLVLASKLFEHGHNVEVLVHSKEQCKAIQSGGGLTFINDVGEEKTLPIGVTTNPQNLNKKAIWILAVKYHHLQDMQLLFDELPEETILLFIQNGIKHIEFARDLKQKNILMGTIEFGAEKVNSNKVIHRGIGIFNIANFKGEVWNNEKCQRLTASDLPISFSENYLEMLLRKTIVNCLINTLTTLLGVPNGDLIRLPSHHRILKELYFEIVSAFPEQKNMLPFSNIEQICKNTSQNTSSMLADYRHGRKMEIDTIVGGVMVLAKERGHDLPMLKTLYLLLLALEGKEE